MPHANTQHKDRLFCYLFGSEQNKAWTLNLYNAVNRSAYTDPDQIRITTIKDVLYMSMHNDVSFMITNEMCMYEHQSTWNPNVPLRMLQYAAGLYEKEIRRRDSNKYSGRIVPLPVPRLMVFYNGIAEQPDEITIRLSDAFPAEKRDESDIEVRVRMININHGHNPQVMEACKPLQEYAMMVDMIRQREPEIGLEAAISETIDQMPEDWQISAFMREHKAEAIDMFC